MKKTFKNMLAVLSAATLCTSSMMISISNVSAEEISADDTTANDIVNESGTVHLFGYDIPYYNEYSSRYIPERFSFFDTFVVDDGYSITDIINSNTNYCSSIEGPNFKATGTWGDNITWSFDDGVLEISGTGAINEVDVTNDLLDTTLPHEVYPWSSLAYVISDIIIDDGITRIPDNCFGYCWLNTRNIKIGADVEYIGEKAFDFYGYDKTKEVVNVYLPEKVAIEKLNFWHSEGKIVLHGYKKSPAYYFYMNNKDKYYMRNITFDSIGEASKDYIEYSKDAKYDYDYTIDINKKTLNATFDQETQLSGAVQIAPVIQEDNTIVIGNLGKDEDYLDYIETLKIQDGATKIGCINYATNLKTIIVPDSVIEFPNKKFLSKNISKLTIVANTGTYAESYAKENGINFVDAKEYSENSTLDSVKLNDATEPTKSTESATIDTSNLGDLNLDGKVGIDDAVILNKYLVDSAVLTGQGKLNADCDKDGSITAADSLRLLEYLVGSINEL